MKKNSLEKSYFSKTTKDLFQIYKIYKISWLLNMSNTLYDNTTSALLQHVFNELRQEKLLVDTVNLQNQCDKVGFKWKCYRFT